MNRKERFALSRTAKYPEKASPAQKPVFERLDLFNPCASIRDKVAFGGGNLAAIGDGVCKEECAYTFLSSFVFLICAAPDD
jgi:hypothetical protein